MKNLFITLIISVSFITTSWAQKEVPCETHINNITLYLQGAEINSDGKASLPTGEGEVVFTGLPNSLDPKTIQLSSPDDVTILSVTSRINYIVPRKEQDEIKKLQDSIDILKIRIAKIDNRKSVITGMEDMLNANKNVGGANVGVNPESLAKVYDYYNEKMTHLENEELELSLEEGKLKKTLDEFDKQLNERNSNSKTTMEVVATVNSKSAAAVNFKLSYLVNNAGWTPEYDIRGEGTSSPVKLTYKANVWQSTGVNWDKVKMKISTGNPTVTAQGPIYATWFYNYMNSGGYGRDDDYKKEELQDVTVTAQGIASKNGDSANNIQWTATNTQLATVYDVNVPYSVPDDGKMHTLVMQEKALNANYKYYSIPKIDPDAFLIARINDWESLNLLSANANVFFEGAYVGQTYIDASGTKDTLDISMGRDEKIIIKRLKIKDFDKGKLIGDKVKKAVQYELDVKNTRGDKVNIDIIDQVPISGTNEIDVVMEDAGGAVYQKETGKLTWNFKLAPSEEKKVRFSFSVKYPKAKEIYCPKF